MIRKKLSPILKEINDTLWEFEYYRPNTKPEYDSFSILHASKIFMSVLMDKMYELQQNEGIEIDDSCNMATALGEEMKKMVKTCNTAETRKTMCKFDTV